VVAAVVVAVEEVAVEEVAVEEVAVEEEVVVPRVGVEEAAAHRPVRASGHGKRPKFPRDLLVEASLRRRP
jgi:hypothetical protein